VLLLVVVLKLNMELLLVHYALHIGCELLNSFRHSVQIAEYKSSLNVTTVVKNANAFKVVAMLASTTGEDYAFIIGPVW
jgi:hypothetical protein